MWKLSEEIFFVEFDLFQQCHETKICPTGESSQAGCFITGVLSCRIVAVQAWFINFS